MMRWVWVREFSILKYVNEDVPDNHRGWREGARLYTAERWLVKASLEDTKHEGPVVLSFYPGDGPSACTDQRARVQQ